MPFDFKKFDAECATMDAHGLQLKWEHYTRQISGAATSTAVSGAAMPFTFGVSGVGICFSAPAIHNARKKREIIEKHLQRLGTTHHTRKRDVITAGAISGGVGLLTLGLAPIGAESITNSAAEHGLSYIAENELGVKVATHFAMDAALVVAEEVHMHSKEEHEAWKAYEKAIREGKNPQRPASYSKHSGENLSQPPALGQDSKGSHVPAYTAPYWVPPPPMPQYNQSTATSYFPPPMPQYTQPTETSYFPPPPGNPYLPPPPGQSHMNGTGLGNRRHSTSTLSSSNWEIPHTPTEPQGSGRFLYGTTTAISAPMAPNQSYLIEISEKPVHPPSRRLSAVSYTSNWEKGDGNPALGQQTAASPVYYLPPTPTPPPPYAQSGEILSSEYRPPLPTAITSNLISSMASDNLRADVGQDRPAVHHPEYTSEKSIIPQIQYFPPPPTSAQR